MSITFRLLDHETGTRPTAQFILDPAERVVTASNLRALATALNDYATILDECTQPILWPAAPPDDFLRIKRSPSFLAMMHATGYPLADGWQDYITGYACRTSSTARIEILCQAPLKHLRITPLATQGTVTTRTFADKPLAAVQLWADRFLGESADAL